MSTFRATHGTTGEVVVYDAAAPQPAHQSAPWTLEQLIEAGPSPDDPIDTRRYGGRRLLSKVEFIALFSDAEYAGILATAKQSVAIEGWIKKLDYATPDAYGHAVDLDSANMQAGVRALETAGLLAAGRAAEVLNG